MKNKKKKAFTLVELLAVIVILGVLCLIGVPVVMRIINKSDKKVFVLQVQSFGKAINSADVIKNKNNNTFYYSDIMDGDNGYKGVGVVEGNSTYITLCNQKYCAIEANPNTIKEENLIQTSKLDNYDGIQEEDIRNEAFKIIYKSFLLASDKYYEDNFGDEGDIGNTIVSNRDEQTIYLSYDALCKAGYIGCSSAFEGYAIVSNHASKNKAAMKRTDDWVMNTFDSEPSPTVKYDNSKTGTHRSYSKSEFMNYLVNIASQNNKGCYFTSDNNSVVFINNDDNRKIVRAGYRKQEEDGRVWYYLVGVDVRKDESGKLYAVPDTINEDTADYDATMSNLNYKAIEYNSDGKDIDFSNIKCENTD